MTKIKSLFFNAILALGILAGYYIYIYNQPPIVVKVQIVEKTVYVEREPTMMTTNEVPSVLVLGPGYLSAADPGVLERVALRRMAVGWGLAETDIAQYDALVATIEWAHLGRAGWLIADKATYTALVVDCAQAKHRQAMMDGELLADVNRPQLVHKRAVLLLLSNWNN
jgi:hypothetical protein